MNVVIIGGTGLIGTKLCALLQQAGHRVTAASPSSGVNAVTGEGLAEVMAGTDVVVDVTNSPSFEDEAVMHFFQSSTRNLLTAEAAAGVRHHVALSVVGSERLPDSGYFRAKVAQESLIQGGSVPYTIVRATQFFEFLTSIAHGSTRGQAVHLSPARIQPMAAADVAQALAEVVGQPALNGKREITGPQAFRLDELIRRVLQARHDTREVVTDADEPYFGTRLTDASLTAGANAWTGKTTLEHWLAAQAAAH